MRARRLTALCLAVSTAAALAACGSDDGSGVRVIGTETAASGTASGSGSGAVEAVCDPVGEDLTADEGIDMALVDYGFDPAELEVAAGTIRFDLRNEGSEAHELAFLPGGDEVPFTDGAPDEAALEGLGAFELEAFGPGQDCAGTWELEPGTYTLFCIVETPDGVTHYEKGMEGTLTVTG